MRFDFYSKFKPQRDITDVFNAHRLVSDKPSKRSSENRFFQFSDDLSSQTPYFGV